MTSSTVSHLIFVDSNVDDYQSLLQGASANADIALLNADQDGIEQISRALVDYSNLESVEIVSHGSEGVLQLGATQLSAKNLSDYAVQLQSWSGALAEAASLLLYGCNVAAGATGEWFVQQLSQFTGAAVAASRNLTGSGGDWELEYRTGTIAAASGLNRQALAAYSGTLVTVSNDAQLRQSIKDANTAGTNVEIFVTRQIVLVDELPEITGNITFIGASNTSEISGGGLYQIFRVDGETAKVTFKDLTIANGIAEGSPGANNSANRDGSEGHGGGLILSQGDVTLVNVVFRNNRAEGGNGGISDTATGGNGGNGYGGAVYVSGGALRISKTIFLNNTAQAGAAGVGKTNGQIGESKGGALYVAGGTVTTENTPGYTGNKATSDNNVSGSVIEVFPPTVSIGLLDAADTAAATVRYAVTFDRDVTGVDSSDFDVETKQGIAGAQIQSVTGDGREYIVEVSTGTGNGKLQLQLTDDDSIKNGDLPLGGTGEGDDVIGPAYTINKTPPTVTSIKPKTAALTAADSVVFTVVFNESVKGVDIEDFALVSAEIKDAEITSVQQVGVSGTSYEVTVNTGTGDGQLGLNLVDNDSILNVRDVQLGGTAKGDFTGEAYTIKKTPPAVSSITLVDASPTNKDSVSFEVNFSEAVSGVDGSDFTLATSAGIQGAGITTVQPKEGTSGKTYTLSVNTGSGDGTIQLNLKDNDSIKNGLGVALGDSNGGTNGDFAGGIYTLLKFAPHAAAINLVNPNPTAAGTVEYQVTFTQDVTGVDVSDFSLTSVGITDASIIGPVTGRGSNYYVRVNTGTGNGTLKLDLLDDDSIHNAIDATLGGTGTRNGDFSGQSYTINKTPPKVASINRLDFNPANSSSVTFTAIFNENVNLVDTTDFALVTSGITGARISSIKRVNGSFYEVEVDTGTGNGTIGLNLNDNDSIINERGAILGGAGLGNGSFTGEVYTIDKTNPTANIVNIAPDPRRDKVSLITIDFSEAVSGFDLADLSLTRDGKAVNLSKAALTTNDGQSWTLSNIKKLTNEKGDYVLSIAAGDSGIVDVARNPLTTNLTERWTNLVTVDACDPGILRRGTNAADTLTGTADKDTLLGNDGNDTLLGLDCGDRLVGDQGNDIINGGEGNDAVVGGVGNDILIGGSGQDVLKGGAGKDRFVFSGTSRADALSTSLADAPDRVQGFKFSQKDKFQLDFDNNLKSKNRPGKLYHAGKVEGKDLSAAAKAAYTDKNQDASGNQSLKANEAVFFKWKNRTYLSVNDSSSGFSANRDLVANVGIQFKPGDAEAGTLSVSNYFI